MIDKKIQKILSEMLLVANHLESRADGAYMEHDDVIMSPCEVYALSDDIKSWYNMFIKQSGRKEKAD
mgnify:FL=1